MRRTSPNLPLHWWHLRRMSTPQRLDTIVVGPAITYGEEVVLLFAAIRLLLLAIFRAGRSDTSLGETGRQKAQAQQGQGQVVDFAGVD